jgi:peptidoglycan hydrolase CwlO-like protein
LQWSLNSDIDKRLRSAFSQSLAMEVEQVRKEIEAAVNKEVGQTRAQLQKEVDKYSKDINLQLKEMGLQISEENEAVAKLRKEIEGVVGDQTKDLEKKIKDLLPF